ncbi:hypothetical protein BDV36DRAFT_135050 [Aspergillus pseudocaelatus]|uniref:Uncharacterized protein n=1 Tax=Aspergillus pseudocaelatus TaxID=1825620 RepID=A0ABQ6VZI4_9EURO|nr:hypothetical protein BDV36DRAFT_135050 [Aspergillus pseudocaelatus]
MITTRRVKRNGWRPRFLSTYRSLVSSRARLRDLQDGQLAKRKVAQEGNGTGCAPRPHPDSFMAMLGPVSTKGVSAASLTESYPPAIG